MWAQQPIALLLLGLTLGVTARLNCIEDTYPHGHKCCNECQPGEWPGFGMQWQGWGGAILRGQ